MPLGIDRDERDLHDTGDEHAPGSGLPRVREPMGEQQRHDHDDVEQDRRTGRRREPAIGVELARDHGLHRHEQERREGDAGERHGEVVAGRIVRKSEQANDGGRVDERQRQQHDVDGEQGRRDTIGEEPRRRQP